MSFSDTSGPGVVGIAVSACATALADCLIPSVRELGFDVRCYDLSRGGGIDLEADASTGGLKLLVELGLEDYLIEVFRGRGSVASRLTGAITGKVPQIWVFCRGSVHRGGSADTWDLAGRQLAWLASAALVPPEVFFCQDDDTISTLAQSFILWAVPSVTVASIKEEALLQDILNAVRRMLQTG